MLCETCRWSGRPGFVGAYPIAPGQRAADHVRWYHAGREPGAVCVMIPCPDCGGYGIAHCCDGICEQPAPVTGTCGSAPADTVP